MNNERQFTSHGLTLTYSSWGKENNPPLLLLHGFTGAASSWASLASLWSHSYFVVAPDLPGHGQSPPLPVAQDMSVSQTAIVLHQLMLSLGAVPYGVVGYSFGGRIALHLLTIAGQEISCAILESTSPGIADDHLRQLRQISDQELARRIIQRGMDWFVPYWTQLPLFSSQSRLPKDLQAAQVRERSQHTPWGLAQSLRGAGTGTQEPLWNRLASISSPTLLITGLLDQKYHAIALTMQQQWPSVKWTALQNAGHNVHLEQPDHFLNIASPFLTQHLLKKGLIANG